MKARLEELQAKLAIHEEKANSQTSTTDSPSASEAIQAPHTADHEYFPFKLNQILHAPTETLKQQLRPQFPPDQTSDETLSDEGTIGIRQTPMSGFTPTPGCKTSLAQILSLDWPSRARNSSQEIIIRDLFELQAKFSNKLNDLQQDGPEFVPQHDTGNGMTRSISYPLCCR